MQVIKLPRVLTYIKSHLTLQQRSSIHQHLPILPCVLTPLIVIRLFNRISYHRHESKCRPYSVGHRGIEFGHPWLHHFIELWLTEFAEKPHEEKADPSHSHNSQIHVLKTCCTAQTHATQYILSCKSSSGQYFTWLSI